MATDPELADELVATVREWVRKDVIPVASDFEHADRYPEAMVEQMKAFGLFGSRIPEEHGGLELDVLTYARLMEELSYGWMSLAGVLNTHYWIDPVAGIASVFMTQMAPFCDADLIARFEEFERTVYTDLVGHSA